MKISKKLLDNIQRFENVINYKFKNKEYILEALTHSSYSNENKKYNFNERLEFLGDSVLGIVISDYLFNEEANLPEGELTKLRANIVCEDSLSEVANDINLGIHMLLGRGEEATGGRQFILHHMENIIYDSRKGNIFRDYKTHLQEVLQGNGENNIWYRLIEEKGPDHNKRFVMEVGINDDVLGIGEGKSKKEAEQLAAKIALKKKLWEK